MEIYAAVVRKGEGMGNGKATCSDPKMVTNWIGTSVSKRRQQLAHWIFKLRYFFEASFPKLLHETCDCEVEGVTRVCRSYRTVSDLSCECCASRCLYCNLRLRMPTGFICQWRNF